MPTRPASSPSIEVGREIKEIRAVGPYGGLRLYDQGRDLYVDRTDPKTSQMDIWKIDLDRDSETRVTSEPAAALNPVLRQRRLDDLQHRPRRSTGALSGAVPTAGTNA